METYLGLDFGGTKLLIGEVDGTGYIINSKRYNTGYVNQQSAVDIIKSSLADYLHTIGTADRQPAAIGIGMIGRVDSRNGRWLQIDPTRTQTIDLADEMSRAFGLPCFLNNDVKSAATAEQLWGYGQLTDNFTYINVGTGIAAASVVDGKMILGSHFNAGEVGHTQVGVQVGVHCCCGRTDCVEAIAAGVGFDSCARLLYPRYPDTALDVLNHTETRIDVRDIYALSRQGDRLCQVLVDNAAQAIANLIMNLVRVTDPDTIVLGGGIVSDPFMYENILARLHPGTMRFVSNGVVITRLDPAKIGLLGAAAIAATKNLSKQYKLSACEA